MTAHPQEIPLVFRAESGAVLPRPAFGALEAEATALGAAHLAALFAQVRRQTATLAT